MTTPFILSKQPHRTVLTAIVDGSPRTIDSLDPRWDAVQTALANSDEETFLQLFRTPLEEMADDLPPGFVVASNAIVYRGIEIRGVLFERFQEFRANGLPLMPFCRFIAKLTENPSFRAVTELYTFLEHGQMPITEDGDFLAYKAIRQNWFDIWSGTVENKIGAVVSMPRSSVDDDCNVPCSKGYHAGTLSYVRAYGGRHSRYVIVKINPADVVSVPKDYGCQKLRTCRYTVVSEFTDPMPNVLPIYGDDGGDEFEGFYGEFDDTAQELFNDFYDNAGPTVFLSRDFQEDPGDVDPMA